jgi:hypothetical protein
MAAPTAINKASKIIGLTDAGKKIFPKILSFLLDATGDIKKRAHFLPGECAFF